MKLDSVFMNVTRKILKAGKIPMLLGEPGIGKSSWVIDLANVMHTKVFILACNQLADKADLTGCRLVPVTDANGEIKDYEQVFYPHAIIRRAIAYAEEHPRETPILFMDELNRTTPDVTSECLSIPTNRSIGNADLPKNLLVITAGNDKGNITSLDSASISRFVPFHIQPDVGTFIAVNPELNPFVANVLRAHPETLFCKAIRVEGGKTEDDEDKEVDINEILDEGEGMDQFTTPRTISAASAFLNECTNQELLELLGNISIIDGEEVSALQETLEAHTGRTAFTAFLLSEIAAGINTVNNQGSVLSPTKPACYDEFKSQPNVSELNRYISSMSTNDKSGSLVYLLYEKEDNTKYINALAPAIQSMVSNDAKMLVNMSASGLLDKENVDTLMRTNTRISESLSIMLGA